MALDDGEKLQVAEIVKTDIDASLSKKIPRLMKLEALTRPIVIVSSLVVTVVTAAIAAPFVLDGAKAFLATQTRAVIADINKNEETNPAVKLNKFSKGLQETFGGQADSATFKWLRFGCAKSPADVHRNIPLCAAAESAPNQAVRAVSEEDAHSIAFAARPDQSTRLTLVMRPVDNTDLLNNVALEIYWRPVDASASRGEPERPIPPSEVKLLTKEFLLEETPAVSKMPPESKPPLRLKLYGILNGVESPLDVTIDLTDFLREIKSDLHQVVIRAVPRAAAIATPNQPAEQGLRSVSGNERFFLRAYVAVSHVVKV